MLKRLKELQGYVLQAVDGPVGAVSAFYIDERDWAVRFLAVDTGDWLEGRRVFIALDDLGQPDHDSRVIPVNRRRDELSKQAPPGEASSGAIGVENLTAIPLLELGDQIGEDLTGEDANPRAVISSSELTSYRIEARDGDIGRIDDFIVEDSAWNVLYLVVDTGGWTSSRQVVVSPSWITEIDQEDAEVEIDLKKETIANSPALDPDTPIDQNFETRIYDHYRKNQPRKEDS
ncbi:MAG: hypothetical protein GX495_12735 [Chloroflexi bacterium]|nr:hypothetical protein [Chloroflexota bacterium]